MLPVIINPLMYMLGENFSLSSCWINADKVSHDSSYISTTEDNRKNILGTSDDYEKGNERQNNNNNNTSSNSSLGPSDLSGSHQAKEFHELGERVYQGDKNAMQEWINKVGPIVQKAQHSKYGIKNSMIIAQIIIECGWMYPQQRFNSEGTSLVGSTNNVLSVNYDMGRKISSQHSE